MNTSNCVIANSHLCIIIFFFFFFFFLETVVCRHIFCLSIFGVREQVPHSSFDATRILLSQRGCSSDITIGETNVNEHLQRRHYRYGVKNAFFCTVSNPFGGFVFDFFFIDWKKEKRTMCNRRHVWHRARASKGSTSTQKTNDHARYIRERR